MIQELQEAYKRHDLKALDTLVKPCFREINKKSDFKSPIMLSANNIKHLLKIATLEADAVILNPVSYTHLTLPTIVGV